MKISKLKVSDIIFKASIDDLEKIIFCRNNNVDGVVDVGIVLGGVSMIPDRADVAYDLYKKGIIKKLLLSGGIGKFSFDKKNKEAIRLLEYFIDKGVSSTDITIEDMSTSTIENISNSYKILDELYDLDNISISIITSDFHLLRSILLLEKKIGHNVFGYGVKSNYSNFMRRFLYVKEVIQLINLSRNNLINDFDVDGLSFIKRR